MSMTNFFLQEQKIIYRENLRDEIESALELQNKKISCTISERIWKVKAVPVLN
jgi:hypothetical protein